MFKLENKVEIIVPQKDNKGKEIDNVLILEELESITGIAGGCTVTNVKGQWWSDEEQRIMQDDNINYEWYYDKDMQDMRDKQSIVHGLTIITSVLIEIYKQEAVSIKIDGSLYIVDEKDINFLSHELYKLMF